MPGNRLLKERKTLNKQFADLEQPSAFDFGDALIRRGSRLMTKIGKNNSLTDVEGLLVGHYSNPEEASGVTVTLCPEGATAGVDVRGSAPGTRETDLLQPHNLVEKVQAIVLTGGSVYGLAACDGVVRWLAEKGWGFPLGEGQVAPIVPGAALFDLGRGKNFIPSIGPDWGRMACDSATNGLFSQGSVGAGTGALSGGIKGGMGTASEVLSPGYQGSRPGGGQLSGIGYRSGKWSSLGNPFGD